MADPPRARSGTNPARLTPEGQRLQGFGRGGPLAHHGRPYSPYETAPGRDGSRLDGAPRGRLARGRVLASLVARACVSRPLCLIKVTLHVTR